MATIKHRVGNPTNLTAAEVDTNFDNLNTAIVALQNAPQSGVTTYVALTDASSANLPTTNAPLAAALIAKAPVNNPAFTGTVLGVTKTHVGLSNVDNTSDVNKPVSTAQAAADALKAPIANPAFTGTVTGVSAAMVGLGSVNNTTDLAKPISTATAAALAAKQPTLIAGTNITIDGTNTISASSGNAAVSIPYSATIPLDTAGNGKYMTAHTMTGSITLAVGASPVEGGNCNLSLIGGGGSYTVNTSAFSAQNAYVYDDTTGVNNIYATVYTYGTPMIFGFLGSSVASLPGQVITLALGTATATTQPLTWALPLTGGTPADYLVEYKAAASGTWLVFSDGVSTTRSVTVTGLTAATSYNYRVSATNAAGTGTASATGTGSTLSVPGQVTGLSASGATTTTQPLTWTAPSTGGATADYIVEYKTHAGSVWLTFTDGVSTTTSATVTGLTSGVSYDYRVSASNGAGVGTVSSTVTASTSSGGGKITFTDDFTGTNGDAPNARWTVDQAGWTIQGNRLNFNGASYGVITAACTAGDNTISVDMSDGGNLASYMGVFPRYIDANNYTAVQVRGDNSEILRIFDVVAGVVSNITNDTAARFGFDPGANMSVAVVGNLVTVTVTGGDTPGSFSGSVSSSNAAATKFALGMNNSKPSNFFDNCVLS